MKMRSHLAILPLLAAATPAYAQANKAEEVECPSHPEDEIWLHCRINVIGNLDGSVSERTETIATVNVDSGRIEASLLNVPGLQQFRRSDARTANPTSQGITMRGLGGNASSRALLFLDDVPQADPFGGWVSWPGYDALNLASIRVRKGGGQVAAGPGAVSGVVE
ncbi:MAG: TonB-dependent receptor, partial [Sphingomonadales bacterium]